MFILDFFASIPTIIYVPFFTIAYFALVYFFCRFFGFVKDCDREIEEMQNKDKFVDRLVEKFEKKEQNSFVN